MPTGDGRMLKWYCLCDEPILADFNGRLQDGSSIGECSRCNCDYIRTTPANRLLQGDAQGTELVDAHREVRGSNSGWELPKPARQVFTFMPVLEFLCGLPWDNLAVNYVYALRPSYVRVGQYNGAFACDSQAWRVTVYLEADRRTICHIDQEVICGGYGVKDGSNLRQKLKVARRSRCLKG
jgi:hypothetical protein